MSNKTKVSVIVPIYNVEEYINECLDSLVDQTLDEIEVLMVNDGSTDSSGKIAEEYADKYENFHLLTKSNGGQGQARNYAIPFVKGEYIAFVDPDDFVSKDAYKKLYDLSENGKHDIITGNVIRFNSKREYTSILHAKVFKDDITSTHITKNPELIYDTTSCNKLFKTEFWKENDLKFPEGVLYEDIPLTFLAYIKSKSTAVLTDIIYYWRERDGLIKSITQQRTNINNFVDRLYCLKIVDKFIEENVSNETLIYYKYFKWIDLDLKLYINKLDQVNKDYIDQFIPIIKEYIKTIPQHVFKDLRAIDRIKYYFIEKEDIKSLLEALNFENNRMKYLEVVRKGDNYFGKFPFKSVPEEYFKMTKELNTNYKLQKNDVKVSVIVPIYNVEEYIKECLDSLVNQSLKEIEVIMVNDGSTDSSVEIATKYAKKHENFHLITKPNGGLGQARNYAIPLVNGEYIAFLDSDDFVSKDAYKKLYEMSENGKQDIVIGNVMRFNSQRYYSSSLHAKIFKDDIASTHITKNPELIYDTTAWNKLFKTKFWRENNFKFPEGVLYEDIPVTIPAHFKSASTAVLTDIIYYWRERDGLTKSITQERTDITNFTDRLSALKSVDKFIEENVTDEVCIYCKYFKWVDLDLKIYINKLDQANDEYIKQFIPSVQKYIKTIPKNIFNDLRAIDRIKYYLLEKGDHQLLLEVLNFEKSKMKYLEVIQKGNTYFGKFPFKGVPEEYFEMTKELNNVSEVRKINKINISEEILDIKGYIYINRVNFDKKHHVNLKAKLVNTSNNHELPVNIKNMKIPELTQKFGVRVKDYKLKNRLYNYEWAGYHIQINLNDPEFLKLGTGQYQIVVNLQMPGINRDIIVGSSNKKTIKEPYLSCHNSIMFEYNAKRDLCIFITEMHVGIVNSYFKDNNLYLEGWVDNKSLTHEFRINPIETGTIIKEPPANNYTKIPITTTKCDLKLNRLIFDKFHNAEYFMAFIPAKLIKNLEIGKWSLDYYRNNQKEDLNGNIYQKKIFDNNLIELYSSKSEGILLTKYNAETYLNSLIWENDNLKLSICLNKSSLGKDQEILNSKLRCVSKKQGAVILFKEENTDENEDILKNTFIVETKDKLGNNIFLSDKWEFYVDYTVKSGIISHKIQIINGEILENKQFKTHKYKLINSNGFLGLKVSLIWSREANTTRKREALERYIYPLMRLLPLNKKRIVFESYWSNKYNCNPRYLYEYIDKNHPEYDCIWVVFDESMKINGNAKKVRFRSLKYFYYMATARYFVNNVNFPDFYNKRKGAVEIQTMHGTPLKTMGIDVPGDFKTEESLNRYINRCNRWDYITVSSDKVADIAKRCFMFKKEFLKSGYPRIDEIFALNTPKSINKIKTELNIPEDIKIVLYAPTWRVKNKFDLMLDLKKMKEKLGDKYVLLLRAHPLSAKGLKRELLNDFAVDVTGYSSIEELYVISDVMITDYSSAMFDYGVLNKPMIFFAYDLELYKNNLRGFYLDFEQEVPGPIVSTSDEVIAELLKLDSIKSRYKDKINAFNKNYCQYENGDACKSIFNDVFNKNNPEYKEENPFKNIFSRVFKRQVN